MTPNTPIEPGTPVQDDPQRRLRQTWDYIRGKNSRFTRTFEDFSVDMADDRKRQQTYKWLRENNAAFVVPYERFSMDLLGKAQAPEGSKKKDEVAIAPQSTPLESPTSPEPLVQEPSASLPSPQPDPTASVISNNFDIDLAKLAQLDPTRITGSNVSLEDTRAAFEDRKTQELDTNNFLLGKEKGPKSFSDDPAAGLQQAIGSFNKTVISGTAAIPKTIGIVANELDEIFGTAPKEKKVEEYATYQLGEWLEDKALEWGITATDPRRDQDFWLSAVPQGLGSVASIILLGGPKGMMGRGATVPGAQTTSQLAATMQGVKDVGRSLGSRGSFAGSTAMAVPEFDAAKQAGLSDEDAFHVFLKNYGLGATEILPISNALSRINKLSGGKFMEFAKAGAQGGLEEFIQEGVQTTVSNNIAQGSYDPKRDLFQDVLKSAGAGFFVGFILPGIGMAMQDMSPEDRQATQEELNKVLRDFQQKGPLKSKSSEAQTQTPAGKPADEQQEVPQPDAKKAGPPSGPTGTGVEDQTTSQGSSVSDSDGGGLRPDNKPDKTDGKDTGVSSKEPSAANVSTKQSDLKTEWKGEEIHAKEPLADAQKRGEVQGFTDSSGKKWKLIGKNSIGEPIAEDDNGVRARVTGPKQNVIVTQPVNVVPGQAPFADAPSGEFLTDEEEQAMKANEGADDDAPDTDVTSINQDADEQENSSEGTEDSQLEEDNISLVETQPKGVRVYEDSEGKSWVARPTSGTNRKFDIFHDGKKLDVGADKVSDIKQVIAQEKRSQKAVDDYKGDVSKYMSSMDDQVIEPGTATIIQDDGKIKIIAGIRVGDKKRRETPLYRVVTDDPKIQNKYNFTRDWANPIGLKHQLERYREDNPQAFDNVKPKPDETATPQQPGKTVTGTQVSEDLKKEGAPDQDSQKHAEEVSGGAKQSGDTDGGHQITPKKSDAKRAKIKNLLGELDDLLGPDIKGQANIVADPGQDKDRAQKIALKGAEIVVAYIDMGVTRFAEIARDVYNEYGEPAFRRFFDALKSGYGANLATVDDDTHRLMDADVRKFKVDELVEQFKQQTNVDDDSSLSDTDGRNPSQLDDGGPAEGAGTSVPAKETQGLSKQGRGSSGKQPRSASSGGETGGRSTRDSDGDDSGTDAGPGESGQNKSTIEGRNPQPPLSVNDRNHVISDDDVIIPPGEVGKINANIAAIKLAKKLEEEGRNPTPEEKKILAKYVGWGGLAPVLDKRKAADWRWEEAWSKKYLDKHKELRDLLTDEEFDAAVNSTINAHYTDRRVITKLWDLAKRLGFKGGNVLEPAAGVGHFFGLMPQDIAAESNLRAYELDKISGLIVSKLYPEASVRVTGYEHAVEGNNTQDLVITNVPFAAKAPFDKKHKDISKFSLHNYFIAKAIRQLKPGGIGIFITSQSTMDNEGASTKFRDWAVNDGNADFVGAIRLPNNAFKENAGTEVTTDIVVYRKRTSDLPSEFGQQHRNVVSIGLTKNSDGEEVPMMVNEYFAQNPDMMLGKMMLAHQSGSGGLYGENNQTLVAPKDQDTAALITDRLKNFPENVFGAETVEETNETIAADTTDKEGTFKVTNGKLFMVDGGSLIEQKGNAVKGFNPKTKGSKTYQRVEVAKDYIAIKDAIKVLIAEEQKDVADETLDPLRKQLNKVYDTFLSKYGHLNRNPRVNFLEDDSEHTMVFALEDVKKHTTIDPDGKIKKTFSVDKSGIFDKRVNFPVKEPKTAGSLTDAINISLSYRGAIDLPYVASLVGQGEEETRATILNDGLAFENPVNGLLEDSDSYLSGFVRTKFKEAQQADDPRYERNIKELEKVVPKNIPASMIEFRLGSTWLPTHVVESFIEKTLGVNVKIQYIKAAGVWRVEARGNSYDSRNRVTFASGKFTGVDLIDKALNLRQPEVYYKDSDGNQIKDAQATAAAQAKMQELADMFYNFVKNDTEAMKEIEGIYNDIFNDYVEKKYSLPSFKHFPNANQDISLRQHQRKAVARALHDSTLLAHQVGTGKTFTMITLAMEMRRLGIARKPMITVQNATLEQFAKSFKTLYPASNILAPTKKEMDAKNRQKLFNKIAYNDWDAIIIPQSFLDFIPDSEERERGYLAEQIAEIEAAMAEVAGDRTAEGDLRRTLKQMNERLDKLGEPKETKGKKKTVKDVARANLRVETAHEKQANRRKDDVLIFEQMGVDALFLDEAHAYKKLGFTTKMNKVKGIDTGRSKRAFGAFMKTRWVQEKNKGRNVIFATGTPITNTMAEVWTMMKFVAPDILEKYNINSFDEFATSFGLVEPSLEFTASGKFKIVERFKSYINAPELLTAFRSKADVVLTEDIPEFKEDNTIPKLRKQPDGKEGFTQVILPQTPGLTSMMKTFKNTLEQWEQLTGMEKRRMSYIPLLVFNRAKQAAIDLRLVDPTMEDDPGSKTNRVVKEAKRIYDETSSYKGTQMIFSDMYQSPEVKDKYMDEEGTMLNPAYGKDRFNLYFDIKKKLVQAGVPESEIAIMNEYEGDKREALFNQVNEGNVRILLGSTERMGVGVNVQERLAALHHMDAPPRPMDFEQRNGRIIRQGNLHAQMNLPVDVVTYGVEKTLDATAYQRLSIKQKFINQMMKAEGVDRVMADEADEDSATDMTFDQMMSTLSGSQYAVLHTQKMYDLRKLRTAQANHERNIIQYNDDIRSKERVIELLRRQAKTYGEVREEFKAAYPSEKVQIQKIVIEGKEHVNTKDTPLGPVLQKLFEEAHQRVKRSKNNTEIITLEIDGFKVEVAVSEKIFMDKSLGTEIHIEISNIRSTKNPLAYIRGNRVSTGPGFLTSYQASVGNFIETGDNNHQNYSLDAIPTVIERHEKDIAAYKDLLSKPFDKLPKLQALEAEVLDLEEKMKAENISEEDPDDPDGTGKKKSLEEQEVDFTERSGDTYDPVAGMAIIPWIMPNKVKTKPVNQVAEDALRAEIELKNKDAEARYKDAGGRSPASEGGHWNNIIDSIRDHIIGFRSHFIKLDPRKYAREAAILRVFETIKKSTNERTKQYLQGLMEPLTKEQYEIVTRRIVLEDLLGGIEKGLETEDNLPFGLSSRKEVEQEIAKFEDLMVKEPAAQEAYFKRQAYMESLYDNLVAAEILHPDEDRKTYYHRRVLEYLHAEKDNKVVHGKRLSKAYKDWRRARTGTKGKDYSTNFIESEYRVVAEGLYELEKHRILKELMAPYEQILNNIKKAFKAEFDQRVDDAEQAFGADSDEVEMLKRNRRSMLKTYIEENKPEGYEYYQPTPGNAIFVRKLIDQAKVEAAIQEAALTSNTGIGEAVQLLDNIVDMATPYVLMGQKRKQYLVPKQLADQLEYMGAQTEPDSNVFVSATSVWKGLVLLTPNRFVRYNLNNFVGDLDGTIAADPTILKKASQAWKELREFKNTGRTTPDLNEAFRQNVIDSGWEMTELADLNDVQWVKFLTDQNGPDMHAVFGDKVVSTIKEKMLKAPMKGWKAYWDWAQRWTRIRENTLRYAAYLRAKEKIQNGDKFYWASDPKQIDGIAAGGPKALELLAGKLSRDVLVDYGNISHTGQRIRRLLIPFYAWQEGNMSRWYWLLKNASSPAVQARVAGVMAKRGITKVAFRMIYAYGIMGLLTALVSAWNRWRFPEETEKLRRANVRGMQLILTTTDDGKVVTIPIVGALFDAVDFFGLPDILADDLALIYSGEAPVKGMLGAGKTFLVAPFQRLSQSVNPFAKSLYEVATGQQLYPDVTNPRPIYDYAEYFATFLTMQDEYRAITGTPTRAPYFFGHIRNLVVRDLDPDELSYYMAKRVIGEFKGEHKYSKPANEEAQAKAEALYRYGLSVRFGHTDEALRYLNEYYALGGTPVSLMASLRGKNPLNQLNSKERHDVNQMIDNPSYRPETEFAKTLTSKELAIFKDAINYYERTYDPRVAPRSLNP